jgi:hypothetical protein
MTDAALSGDYVDLRFIKTRKVCQIVIEIPIEQGNAFVQAFGTPNPATGVPVAIARLTAEPKPEKAKRSWGELSRAEQAGMKCNDVEFSRFIALEYGTKLDTTATVKWICEVKSRTELDSDEAAGIRWDALYSKFQRWQRGAIAA